MRAPRRQPLRELWALLRAGRPNTVDVGPHRLRIEPGVLDPVAFRTGAAFGPWVAQQLGDATGRSLLDLGCGSGVVGVFARDRGARVVASDPSPAAVRSARHNGLDDVRQGDLFGPVLGQRFDYIAFNPPFFDGFGPPSPLRRALYGGPGLPILRRFAAGVHRHLAPDGVAWVVLSDRAPWAAHALGARWAPSHRIELPPLGAGPTAVPAEALQIWTFPRDPGP